MVRTERMRVEADEKIERLQILGFKYVKNQDATTGSRVIGSSNPLVPQPFFKQPKSLPKKVLPKQNTAQKDYKNSSVKPRGIPR